MFTYKIEINSTFERVDFAVDEILAYLLEQCSLKDEHLIFIINFTLRELLINAVEHGNKMDAEKKAVCDIALTENEIRIDVFDEGKGFILEKRMDEIEKEDILRLRGRGIYIITKMGFDLKVNKNGITAKLNIKKMLKERAEKFVEMKLDNRKLVLELNSDLVASRIKDLVEKAKKYTEDKDTYDEIILDLHNVKIIDSIGISFIVGLFKTSKNFDRKFKIVGINKSIDQLFKIMKLNEVLNIEIS